MIACLIYLSILCVVVFLIGRVIPKELFHADYFPYRSLKFERDGHIYDKLHVKSWQNKLPDMSRIVPFMMPHKALDGDYASRLPELITETCVAEITHIAAAALGFVCVILWDGPGGIIVSILYALGNIPYVIIQRYNRPRFVRLLNMHKRKLVAEPTRVGANAGKGDSDDAVSMERISS